MEKNGEENEAQQSVTALLEYAYCPKDQQEGHEDQQEWHENYTAMVKDCHSVLSDPAKLTDELLQRLWAKKGYRFTPPPHRLDVISKEDFETHIDYLREVTTKIADCEHSQETLNRIVKSWKNGPNIDPCERLIRSTFATFHPDKVTNLVRSHELNDVINSLDDINIGKVTKNNWYNRNRELLNALDKHISASDIIPDDPIEINIAIGNLHEIIKGKQGMQDKNEKTVPKEPSDGSRPQEPDHPQSNLNTILYGPPGTGKTYATVEKAVAIIEPQSAGKSREDIKHRYDQLVEDGRIAFVTFHQSFSYEDFVEGIRASTVDGQITYAVEPGIFKQIADRARQSGKETPYVLIIDEVNRGNASSIFGELITLLEPEKRLGTEDSRTLTLPYSKEPFGVPDNLYIIGTMNTADRSLTLLDTALRRRFEFEELKPDSKLLPKSIEGIDLRLMLDTINNRIEAIYDREHRLGHAYFLGLKDKPEIAELSRIFDRHIIPLLQEYFFEDWKNIRIVLGDDQKTAAHQILVEKPYPEESFSEANARFKNNTRYVINTKALERPATYIGIYKPEE